MNVRPWARVALAMRVLLVVAAIGCHHESPPPHEPVAAPAPANDSFVPFGVAIVGTPAAVGSCVAVPETCFQAEGGARRLLVGAGVVLLRWHDVAIYATTDEAPAAKQRLDGEGRRFEHARFAGIVGDLSMQHTKPADLELIGKDSGFTLAGPDGFYIECFNCRAPAVLTALASLGLTITTRDSP